MTATVRLTRAVQLPDEIRVARSLRAPELGPRILFFSGGSALKKLSRKLKAYTHNSVHLITPFDSGGSSAQLREAFQMFAVGDVRNRLMALADETARGNPEIYSLFSHRLASDAGQSELREGLARMVDGQSPLIRAVPSPLRRLIRTHLKMFAEHMPEGFDLRGASIGNLVLAGGYLHNERDIDSVIFLFSKLVEVRGLVRPVVDADYHLAAKLADGTEVIGQHRLTGKQEAPITAKVEALSLVRALDDPSPARARVSDKVARLIREADLICYPMGSFYSSLMASLMPEGVGAAVAAAECPKVYVPNTGRDPEQLGLSLSESIERLLDRLRGDAGASRPASDLLHFVLVDQALEHYEMAMDLDRVAALGVEIVRMDLVSTAHSPLIDAERLAQTLLSLGLA